MWYHQQSNAIYVDGKRVLFSQEVERYPMYRGTDIAMVIEDYGNERSAFTVTDKNGCARRSLFDSATAAADFLFKLGFRE